MPKQYLDSEGLNLVLEAIKNMIEDNACPLIEVDEEGFFIVDKNYDVAAKCDSNGFGAGSVGGVTESQLDQIAAKVAAKFINVEEIAM